MEIQPCNIEDDAWDVVVSSGIGGLEHFESRDAAERFVADSESALEEGS